MTIISAISFKLRLLLVPTIFTLSALFIYYLLVGGYQEWLGQQVRDLKYEDAWKDVNGQWIPQYSESLLHYKYLFFNSFLFLSLFVIPFKLSAMSRYLFASLKSDPYYLANNIKRIPQGVLLIFYLCVLLALSFFFMTLHKMFSLDRLKVDMVLFIVSIVVAYNFIVAKNIARKIIITASAGLIVYYTLSLISLAISVINHSLKFSHFIPLVLTSLALIVIGSVIIRYLFFATVKEFFGISTEKNNLTE